MTMQSILGTSWAFPPVIHGSSAPAMTSTAVSNASGKICTLTARFPKSGNVDRVGFNLFAAASASWTARIETVSTTTGLPTGTLYHANATATFTAAAGWNTVTFASSAPVTAGDVFAVVLVASGANSATYGAFDTNGTGNDAIFPYWSRNPTGAGFVNLQSRPACLVRYDDATYPSIPGVYPGSLINTYAYNNGSSPTRRGLKFQVPFKCRVSGWWAFGIFSGDFDAVLYDSSGTLLLSKSNDKDQKGAATGLVSDTFNGTTTLAGGTDYYFMIVPTTVTSLTIYSMSFDSTAVMDASAGGSVMRGATYAGSFTEVPLEKYLMGLQFDQLDDGLNGAGELSVAFAG